MRRKTWWVNLGIVVLNSHRYQYEPRLITVGQVFVLESSLKWPYSFVEVICLNNCPVTGGFKKSLVTWNHYIILHLYRTLFLKRFYVCYCTYFHKPIVGRIHMIWILQIKKQLAASGMVIYSVGIFFWHDCPKP